MPTLGYKSICPLWYIHVYVHFRLGLIFCISSDVTLFFEQCMIWAEVSAVPKRLLAVSQLDFSTRDMGHLSLPSRRLCLRHRLLYHLHLSAFSLLKFLCSFVIPNSVAGSQFWPVSQNTMRVPFVAVSALVPNSLAFISSDKVILTYIDSIQT